MTLRVIYLWPFMNIYDRAWPMDDLFITARDLFITIYYHLWPFMTARNLFMTARDLFMTKRSSVQASKRSSVQALKRSNVKAFKRLKRLKRLERLEHLGV